MIRIHLSQAPEITLLLPRDQHGVLGHSVLQITPDSHTSIITTGKVLEAIYSHYKYEMMYNDQVAAMEADPRIRRMLQVGRMSGWGGAGPQTRFCSGKV